MANSAIVGLLRVLLTANSAEFEAAMKRSADSAKKWSRDLNTIGQQASDVGATLTKALTLPIVGLGVASAKAAIDFESSFAGVRKTVDATEPELQKLAHGFRDLSKQIPINVNELNKIGEAAGQLGIKTENILGFTEVMAKLGVTTNLSSDQAATSLARLANITQMNQGDFDRLGSTIVDLGNNFATTESEIVDFGLRIAGAGKLAGLTEHQILAIGSAMSSVGVEAEAGGTAVQKVLNDITEAVATGNDNLAIFAATAGKSIREFSDLFRKDATGAFLEFVNGLGREGDRAFQILDKLGLGNERVVRAFLSLANAGDLLKRNLDVAADAWERNTALTEEARKRFETTASQLTLLWNRIKDVGITLGNALIPAIKSVISFAEMLIPLIEMLGEAFAGLPGPVQAGVIAIAGMAAATGPLVFMLGQLAIASSGLVGAFGKSGIATKLLTGSLLGLSGATVATNAAAAGSVVQMGLFAKAFALALNPITLLIGGLGVLAFGIYKVAAAETELEKSLREDSKAFQAHTDNLSSALTTYEQLSQKQKLTTDESKRLDEATRALAKASGLSREAFDREANASDDLTVELREQLRARKELLEQAIKDARKAAVDAQAELGKAERRLRDVMDKRATTFDAPSGPGGFAVERPLSTAERVGEIDRLKGAIAELRKNAGEAQKAFTDLAGSTATLSNETLTYAEFAALASTETTKAAPAADDLAKLLANTGKETKKASDFLSEFKENTSELAAKIAAAEKAGAKMPILLDLFGEAANNAAKRGEAWGVKVQDAVMRVAAAFQAARIDAVVKEIMDDAAKEAARLVNEMQRSGEEAGRRLEAGLRERNDAFLDTATELQRRLIDLEDDSLDKRVRLIQFEFNQKRAELDKYSAFYELHLQILNAEEAKALEEARKKWQEEMATRRATIFQKLTGDLRTVTQQFEDIGREGATSLIDGIAHGIRTGDWSDVAETLSSILSNVIASGINALVPGLGTLLEPLINALTDKLFGGLFGSRGRDMVEEFARSMGGFDALRQRLNALPTGVGERLWRQLTQGVGRNNPQQAQAAIDAITAALGRAEEQTAEFNSSLSGMLREVQEMGGNLPAALVEYLNGLRDAGRLTQENIDLLAILSGSGEVSWEKMQELAEKYGISVDRLGQRFQEQRIHAGWQEIIDDIDTLQRGGADMTAVLMGMSDEINELVQDSIQFGTTIPENMRPWIEKMIELGLLMDENGEKITDISQITFGDTLQTSLEKLILKIQDLIDTILGVPKAIDKIPRNVDINVNYKEGKKPKFEPEDGGTVPEPEPTTLAGGGFVPQYAAAGRIISSLFTPKGTDTVPAMLTPGELVLTEGQQGTIAAGLDAAMRFVESAKADAMAFAHGQTAGMRAPVQSGRAGPSIVILELDKRELARALVDVYPNEARRIGVRVRA